jgi:hypothetical protein
MDFKVELDELKEVGMAGPLLNWWEAVTNGFTHPPLPINLLL